jgi:hypothetical protein
MQAVGATQLLEQLLAQLQLLTQLAYGAQAPVTKLASTQWTRFPLQFAFTHVTIVVSNGSRATTAPATSHVLLVAPATAAEPPVPAAPPAPSEPPVVLPPQALRVPTKTKISPRVFLSDAMKPLSRFSRACQGLWLSQLTSDTLGCLE